MVGKRKFAAGIVKTKLICTHLFGTVLRTVLPPIGQTDDEDFWKDVFFLVLNLKKR